MAVSLAQNAIAFLIDLAEQGEIDPWDVQVIDVIDRFLSQLQPAELTKDGGPSYAADLSESGQAFLYASMLVLLKADSLARLEAQVEDELEPEEFFADPELAERSLPSNLERTLRRRAVARPQQNRRVTLPELINQLELMATAMSDATPRIRTRRPRPPSRSKALKAIAELAHDEDLSEVAAALEAFLRHRWQEIGSGQEWLDFERLLDWWTAEQAQSPAKTAPEDDTAHHSPQGERVGVFWALLFLSAQSKVELAQDEFYQDLKVRSFDPASDLNPAELSAFALPD
ncbi:segregation/condensation protein A [Oculatella sp. LEGE 06141]|uniref:segregation/condensation protein A n=1 Tax=Oculatella sp. LEGE 06141 TaxID=1828648 RepID=UPI00187E61A1|nr:segregation/condensation protein A [Oculatella sp. LEGE 06141]MBE9179852.1 segregation/condensation protein A [Oculatella sp. LEGE 06141]